MNLETQQKEAHYFNIETTVKDFSKKFKQEQEDCHKNYF